MRFLHPEWLLLLPMLVVTGWLWKPLRLWEPLRALLLVLLVLVLTRPQIRRLEDGMDLWVLLDRSASTEGLVASGQHEWKRLLERARPGRSDRLRYVDFAAEVMEQAGAGGEGFSGDRGLSRTALALQTVMAWADEDRPARILLFTDGYSTEPLGALGETLAQRGMPLDYRLIREEVLDDYRVSRVTAPPRIQVAEPFLLEIEVAGRPDAVTPLELYRDGERLISTTVSIVAGKGVIRFTERVARPGAHLYEAVVTPEKDAHPGNNRHEAWVEVVGGPRVLLATAYPDDPVAQILAAQGFEVETATDLSSLHLGRLNGCRALILNNVPAYLIPQEFLAGIDFFVREQGGGFLMVGGKSSFGSGGYFQSPVDSLLPVSMELRVDHRRLAVAMAIVLDRSGSMTASVAGAGGRMATKMDLANEGTAKAIELLGLQDFVTVYAVDSEAHRIVPLMNVGESRLKMLNLVRRIRSTGGGIFVYNGLEAGWKAVRKADVGQRHLILFSDAADSEEPGDYKRLLAEITGEGGVVSVIGLGAPTDPDAALLQDIARLGNGRMFFAEDAAQLPNIFAQETVAVARSAFLEDPIAAAPTGLWYEVASDPLEWLPEIDGYNLSYLREGEASQGVVSGDEYGAPLVSWAYRGTGRAGAVAFPLGGEFSERSRAWPGYGDFVQTFVRWLMGEDLPPGIGLRTELTGTELRLDLFYEGQDWERTFSTRPPLAVLSEGRAGGPARPLTWQRMAPGHYQVAVQVPEGQPIRGAIRAGQQALSFGPLVVGSSTEWAFDPARIEDLRVTSTQSGGTRILDLQDAWLRPTTRQFADIRTWLLVAALIAMLAEALVTRLGLSPWPRRQWLMSWLRRAPAPAAARQADPSVGAQRVGVPSGRRARSALEEEREAARKALREVIAETKAISRGVKREDMLANDKPPAPESEEAARRQSRFERAKRR
ncbi:MAG TPA: vWA domain-containing protein [Verrucomicrobiales bacterium]|nr:vWA domain-containing protein [Verrucomicrobiales bacterium]